MDIDESYYAHVETCSIRLLRFVLVFLLQLVDSVSYPGFLTLDNELEIYARKMVMDANLAILFFFSYAAKFIPSICDFSLLFL